MATSEPAQTLLWGLTVSDAITSILVPVVVAVLTVLILQEHVQKKERRTQILRMLLATRHTPADAAFNASINLIPVEFNRAKDVMAAWSAYIQQVRYTPVPEDQSVHQQQMLTKQTKLIAAIMKKLGMTYSEADLQVDGYISNGFVWRDNLYLDSLKAQRDAAEAMKGVAEALRVQTGLLHAQLTGVPSTPLPGAPGPPAATG